MEQCEKFGLAQVCLPEHCVEEGSGNITAHLMAQADLKNLARGQHLSQVSCFLDLTS